MLFLSLIIEILDFKQIILGQFQIKVIIIEAQLFNQEIFMLMLEILIQIHSKLMFPEQTSFPVTFAPFAKFMAIVFKIVTKRGKIKINLLLLLLVTIIQKT